MFIKNKNIKLLLNYGIGPVLFVWLSYSIYQQIKHQPHLQEALDNLHRSVLGSQSWKLYAVMLLMLANWGVEARKWQVLMKPLEKISLLKSFKAILAGLAFSMNTPNRIGEFGGRVLYVQDGHRWKAVSLTIMGSFSQVIITLSFGLGGLLFLLTHHQIASSITSYIIWIRVLFFGTLLVTGFLLILYFRLGELMKWVEKIPRMQKYLQHLAIIENLPVTILLRTISLSVVRYIIFVIQYILLLQLFDVQAGVWQLFWLISVVYLMLAIIPTIALAEAGVRGQVGLLLLTLVSTNKLGIAGATTGIWFCNLVIPALAGSLLFLGIKIFSDK
jgi:Lysylphosphatidylglycerol synthase TM region